MIIYDHSLIIDHYKKNRSFSPSYHGFPQIQRPSFASRPPKRLLLDVPARLLPHEVPFRAGRRHGGRGGAAGVGDHATWAGGKGHGPWQYVGK